MPVEVLLELLTWPIEKVLLVTFGGLFLFSFALSLFWHLLTDIRKMLDNVTIEVTPRKQPDQKPRRPDLSGKPPKRI